MTTRQLFRIVLPLLLTALVLQTMDARQRWRASRTAAEVEHTTNELRATGQELPKHLVDHHLLLLKQAAHDDPLLVDVGVQQGIQYLLASRPRDAVRILEAALEVEERAAIHANLGVAYLMIREPQKAAEAFERAVALDKGLSQRIDEILASSRQ